jgi:hypothetical protein
MSIYELSPERVGEFDVVTCGSLLIHLWWIPNAACHRQMLEVAWFEIERVDKLFSIPFGPAHASYGGRQLSLKALWQRLATGGEGVAHQAVLARAT